MADQFLSLTDRQQLAKTLSNVYDLKMGPAARAAFRKHYDAEIAKKRDEYEAHRPLLENFKTTPGPK